MTDDSSLDASPLRTIGWAFFLGASWTWCIGMFFPVLLIREFGVWGWVVFAFPNVLGSAIAGSVMGSAGRSQKILAHHAPWAILFSIVTIAFHVFFVGWQLVLLIGIFPAAATFLLAAVFFAIGQGTRRDLVLAVVVIGVSLVAMAFVLTQPLGNEGMLTRADPSFGLIALTPVCMIGFFLCPYLDLTYHRARQHTAPQAGARAFQIGFFGPFFVMILFTLLYARWIDHGTENLKLRWAIGVHMIVQIALTLALHMRGTLDATAGKLKPMRWLLPLGMLIGLGLAILALTFRVIRQHETGEVIYLCFMGCYGALFPAYVLLCMMPAGSPATPDRSKIIHVLITTALVFPCYWMGLIEHQTGWLLVGVLILLLSRFRLSRPAPPRALT